MNPGILACVAVAAFLAGWGCANILRWIEDDI